MHSIRASGIRVIAAMSTRGQYVQRIRQSNADSDTARVEPVTQDGDASQVTPEPCALSSPTLEVPAELDTPHCGGGDVEHALTPSVCHAGSVMTAGCEWDGHVVPAAVGNVSGTDWDHGNCMHRVRCSLYCECVLYR